MKIFLFLFLTILSAYPAWEKINVDTNLIGADGLHFNKGRSNEVLLAVPWEESGRTRIYQQITNPPYFTNISTISNLNKVEHSHICYLDTDEWPDVVHFLDAERKIYLSFGGASNAFTTILLTNSSRNETRWVVGDTADMNGDGRIDIVAGAKTGISSVLTNGEVIIFYAPANPRTEAWTSETIFRPGRIMDLELRSINQSIVSDFFTPPQVLLTDRFTVITGLETNKDNGRTWWLEKVGSSWVSNLVGSVSTNINCLLGVGDFNIDHKLDVIECRGKQIRLNLNLANWKTWSSQSFTVPEFYGEPFCAQIEDLDKDGANDLVIATDISTNLVGVFWVKDLLGDRTYHAISGTTGTKYDKIRTRIGNAKLDFNNDGWTDVITVEHNEGLVIYLNPGF